MKVHVRMILEHMCRARALICSVRAILETLSGASIAARGQANRSDRWNAESRYGVLTWHDAELHGFRKVANCWQTTWHLVTDLCVYANTLPDRRSIWC